ncbi:MAG: glycosyltransferase [Prevotellaceae bacterium]|jgi:glycosyltransferase involved in cell wall biosynthesis|nr:glycosyltransferase [Prevotellaceae bacterium]
MPPLSILIPVYNRCVAPLVERLCLQAGQLDIPYEIVLADDASADAVREANRRLCAGVPQCRLCELAENRGPAFVRNYLAAQARHPYLLFLDADTMPQADDFLARYLRRAEAGGVVCGGFRYPVPPAGRRSGGALRYKYGTKVEAQPAALRSRHPWQHFVGMNFCVPREVMLRVPFDETFHLGYEDTAFGKQLEAAAVPIHHIDNPVWHLVEEDTAQFLAKTARAVCNLRGHEAELRPYIRLLRWYGALQRCRAVNLTAWLYRRLKRATMRQLLGDNPSLALFAFYKLGTLCCLEQKNDYLCARLPRQEATESMNELK